jgi:hypothetical protein
MVDNTGGKRSHRFQHYAAKEWNGLFLQLLLHARGTLMAGRIARDEGNTR